ncbi:hypothetical protein [Terrabacter terrae]
MNEVRFDVECISHLALAQYMNHRDMTVRSLAAAVRDRLKRRTPRISCSPATIGHLRSGARKNCRPEIAKAIEEALGAPAGSLFVPKLSTVSTVSRRAA